MLKKVYLAGPGVFRRDAEGWGDRLRNACSANGLIGLYPLDQQLPVDAQTAAAKRQWIFANNCNLIRQADAVFADLRAFRSDSEPDSGTAFEVGFAHALGKPVFLWLPDCKPSTELHHRVSCQKQHEYYIDQNDLIVEDFSAPLNLMLWEAAVAKSFQPEPEQALAELAQWLS